MKINEILLEGLTSSVSRTKFVKLFKQNIGMKINSHPPYYVYLNTTGDDLKPKLKMLSQLLKITGWYLPLTKINHTQVDNNQLQTIDGKDFIALSFEPKYDVEVTKIPKYVYHVTNSKAAPKILKMGLTPKTRNKLVAHPDRVYVAIDDKNVDIFIDKMAQLDGAFKPTVLIINTEKIPNVKFYIDPNFLNSDWTSGAMYTVNNISPAAIKLRDQKE